MQDFVYSHAPVESAKAINLHDLASDWINLMEKKKNTHTHTQGIEHVLLLVESTYGTNSTYEFFNFHGMFSLCAVKQMWKTYRGNQA